MSVSGGNANTQFLISGNYNRESNLMPIGGNNQTASTHFSINNTSSNNKFSILFTGGYTYNNNSIPQTDLTSDANLSPVAPALYNTDGTLNFQNNTFDNPLTVSKQINSTVSSNLMGSTVLSYKPITGLEFKATLGYNKQQVNEFLGSPLSSHSPVYIKQQQLTTGTSSFTYNNSSTWSIEPQVNYNLKLGAKGQLSSTLGSSLQNQTAEITELVATGYTSDLLIRSITGGTAIQPLSNVPYDYETYKFSAGFGRLSYNWADKYLFNISGRYDGSSRFGEDKRFHLFGAAGAGWIFSEEGFVKKNLPFLSFGKLKASYGVTGNDQIPNGLYLDSYNSGLPYQGIPSLTPGNEPNPNIGWETTKKAELGLELHFLKDRISFEADYYRNRTTDVLLQYPLSIVTGFNKITQNLPANIQNTGLELTLNTTNIRTKDFSWSSSILLTIPRNKLVSYSNLASSALASNYIIGQPVTIVHAYRFAGVNPQTGVYQFYDRNGKIVANPDPSLDRTAIINVDPKVYGALQNTFTYKGFSLNFTFRFIEQNGRNAFGQQSFLPAGITASNVTTMALNRWQKPGDITDIQRAGTSFLLFSPLTTALQSDKGYGDASYIRLQNLAFSYQFAPVILKKLHLQNLRIYLQGSNLLTISKYGSFDPENQSGLSLPPLRIFTTGVQFTF
jgi:TonB-linked SusC/RagA family outer membrane protein